MTHSFSGAAVPDRDARVVLGAAAGAAEGPAAGFGRFGSGAVDVGTLGAAAAAGGAGATALGPVAAWPVGLLTAGTVAGSVGPVEADAAVAFFAETGCC